LTCVMLNLNRRGDTTDRVCSMDAVVFVPCNSLRNELQTLW